MFCVARFARNGPNGAIFREYKVPNFMVLLQPKLNLRVSQKQILTPGLVQMVSVLALNKIELRDMIQAEMMENPVLEELDSQVPLIDDIAGKEAQRDIDTAATVETPATVGEKEDPF